MPDFKVTFKTTKKEKKDAHFCIYLGDCLLLFFRGSILPEMGKTKVMK
jgi:hypothetical protein